MGLLVNEDGVEEPDFEGTGGGGGEGFDNRWWEAESWFTAVFVEGVPVIEDIWSKPTAAEVAGVESSRSSKPQASAVSLAGDTTNELEPFDVCWLVEEVIWFDKSNESNSLIEAEKEELLRW